MPYVATFGELREWGQRSVAESLMKKAAEIGGKSTFLSHSSQDDDKVAGAALILENHGARVYVDHRDPANAGDDCVEIADHIRKVVGKCERFVMLATAASAESKWIPWELGLADGIHKYRRVALFPSAELPWDYLWTSQEYLGLYGKIVWGKLEGHEDNVWMVWESRSNTATPLRKWLTGQ